MSCDVVTFNTQNEIVFFLFPLTQMSQLSEGAGRNTPLLTQSDSPCFLLDKSLIQKDHCGWRLGPTTHGSSEIQLEARRQKGGDSCYVVTGPVCQNSNQTTAVWQVTYSTFGSFSSNTYAQGTWRQLATEVKELNFPLFYLCFLGERTKMLAQCE